MKDRAILISFKALVDHSGELRPFISFIADFCNEEGYSSLFIVGENKAAMATFCYEQMIDCRSFIESTEPYDKVIASLRPQYKTLGIIVDKDENFSEVNKRLVTILTVA